MTFVIQHSRFFCGLFLTISAPVKDLRGGGAVNAPIVRELTENGEQLHGMLKC